MPTDDLIPMTEAARRYGTSLERLRRSIARGDLTPYVKPLDDRTKLLRVSELEALRQPRPASPAREAAATTAA
jgi:hypothetical protein